MSPHRDSWVGAPGLRAGDVITDKTTGEPVAAVLYVEPRGDQVVISWIDLNTRDISTFGVDARSSYCVRRVVVEQEQ